MTVFDKLQSVSGYCT